MVKYGGMQVGEVRLLGHIGADCEHGAYSGCLAKVFRKDRKLGDVDAQLNRYFEREGRGCLLAKSIPLSSEAILCLIHRALDQENLEELSDFQVYYADFKEKRAIEREKAKAKAQAELDAANAAEQAAIVKQTERLKLVGEVALKHLRNCAKKPEEAEACREILVKLKAIEAGP